MENTLYSVDYPYRSTIAGAEFLGRLPVSPGELADVAGGNAARLLKV